MNKIKSVLFMAGIALLFSCNSNVDSQSPPPNQDSQQEPGYCVYEAEKICLPTQTVCPSSASFRKTCPYSSSSTTIPRSSSSIAPSSSSAVPSSSSTEISSSSVDLCEGFVEGTTRKHYGKEKEQFCDSRDGKKYVYVSIPGNRNEMSIWMAENLNYEVEGSKCVNDDGTLTDENTSNCDTYGRLYDRLTAQKSCPAGWRLPISGVGYYMSNPTPALLRAKEGWDYCTGKSYLCQDTYGFSALPFSMLPSYLSPDKTKYGSVNAAEWWASDRAYWIRAYTNEDFIGGGTTHSSYLYSVRCIKNDY